jgi:membrane protein implicated in regulation of membrane protease activity
MTIGWFISFIILLFIELVTINLVTIWFAIGAVFAMIISFFTDSILIQLLVFLIVSFITLLVTKPLIKKFKSNVITPTNSDRVIGKSGDVIKAIERNKYGEVKIFGNVWTATSDEVIEVGSRVKVLAIDGVKLIVKKEEDKKC